MEPNTAYVPLVFFTFIAADIVLTLTHERVKWMDSGAK